MLSPTTLLFSLQRVTIIRLTIVMCVCSVLAARLTCLSTNQHSAIMDELRQVSRIAGGLVGVDLWPSWQPMTAADARNSVALAE